MFLNNASCRDTGPSSSLFGSPWPILQPLKAKLSAQFAQRGRFATPIPWHTLDFRMIQEAVGTALDLAEVLVCIWHNQCSLKAPGEDQLAVKLAANVGSPTTGSGY